MFFIVTFQSGDRVIVPAASFAEAESRALAAAMVREFPIGGLIVTPGDITGVHRIAPEGAWIGAGGRFPTRILKGEG